MGLHQWKVCPHVAADETLLNPGHALPPVFILRYDPVRVSPSIPPSNIFNFHFVLCATLLANLKAVI